MSQTINQAAEDKKTLVCPVVRTGEAITIPDNISIKEAINVLTLKAKEEEQVVSLAAKFDAFIWDGCYALARALDQRFGWFQQMMTPGSFFQPNEPPALLSVATGPDTTCSVPWGRFTIPGVSEDDGFFKTGYYTSPAGMICFQLQAQIKRKHSKLFDQMCEDVKAQLKAASLYKGKAVTIKFRDTDGDKIDMPEPTFPSIPPITKQQLIFSRHIEAALEANLYTPLQKTDLVRKAGIPLKRGVLLAGPYGVGKTLIANVTTNIAVANGWTFLFCQRSDDFPDCVRFAQRYQPAVVFCEDIDRVTDGDRDEQMDELLNTIDGVDSKGSEILLVLTTNEVENIHQGMLRPGRLDAVISIERPDAEAVERLIHHYGGALLDANEDLAEAGVLLAGSTPSVIREVVERAKLTALSMQDSSEPDLHLSQEALVYAAQTMHGQLQLLNRETAKDLNPMEVFGRVVARELVDAVQRAVKEVPKIVPAIQALPSLPHPATRPNGHE